jgi:branched-subunit amino acid transport protein
VDDRALATTVLVLLCGAGTYSWRAVGVWIADRVNVDSAGFRWVTCVAFAMLAGLVARVVLLPAGELAATPLWARLTGVAVALAVFHASRRNLLAGVLAGSATLPLLRAIAG